jgi:hypothetical protein
MGDGGLEEPGVVGGSSRWLVLVVGGWMVGALVVGMYGYGIEQHRAARQA